MDITDMAIGINVFCHQHRQEIRYQSRCVHNETGRPCPFSVGFCGDEWGCVLADVDGRGPRAWDYPAERRDR